MRPMRGANRALRGAPAAVALLTRVPIPPRWHAADSAVAAPWMPAVGFAIGVVVAGVWAGCARFGAGVQAVAALTVSVLLTGALHEDGLADTADALGATRSRERIFEILKDSRIGSYGATALALSLAWRIALLVALGRRAPIALVVSHALARLAPVWLMAALSYVTPRPVAKTRLDGRLSPWAAAAATVFVGGLLAFGVRRSLITRGSAAAAFGATLATAAILGAWFRARCGGITGDFLGATEQAAECVVLLALVAT